MRHRTSGIKTHSSFENDVRLISWDRTLVIKRGSTPRVPTTTSSYEATTPRYEECSRFTSGTLLCPHFFLTSSLFSQLSKLIILVPLTFFLAHTVNFAQQWWHLTMTNFYRRLSNCQPHHAVHISQAGTTVLTTMTTHNTALGITVPNAPHFLCPAKVRALICLPLMYITID